MNPIEQQFLHEFQKKLWTAAGKLRSALDVLVKSVVEEHRQVVFG